MAMSNVKKTTKKSMKFVGVGLHRFFFLRFFFGFLAFPQKSFVRLDALRDLVRPRLQGRSPFFLVASTSPKTHSSRASVGFVPLGCGPNLLRYLKAKKGRTYKELIYNLYTTNHLTTRWDVRKSCFPTPSTFKTPSDPPRIFFVWKRHLCIKSSRGWDLLEEGLRPGKRFCHGNLRDNGGLHSHRASASVGKGGYPLPPLRFCNGGSYFLLHTLPKVLWNSPLIRPAISWGGWHWGRRWSPETAFGEEGQKLP